MTNRKFFAIVVFMLLLFASVFSAGCGGGGSGDRDLSTPNDETKDNPIEQSTYTVTFDSQGGTDVDSQVVEAGKTAAQPGDPTKNGNQFIGWYNELGFSFIYDFATPVSKDITLHAKWYDENDTTDTDEDGLPDSLEYTFGTDPNMKDTDDDGLTDYEELNYLNYNPLLKDTDGNGVNDGDEDKDSDGLTNLEEGNYGTNMIISDTDHDGLTDYEEVKTYKTDPLVADTDGDGVIDGVEVAIGSDPLVAEETFETKVATNMIASGDEEAVDISVIMDSGAEGAGTLQVTPATRIDNPLINAQIPGYLNAAYEITSDGSFDVATLEFTLGSEVGAGLVSLEPRIYFFNEDTGLLEELENQTFENGKITAQVSHFSTYILLNKIDFDEVWSTDIRPPSNSNNSSADLALDIVFVVDSSYSMTNNDPSRLAISLAKNFIEKLRDGQDKAAVVRFDTYAQTLQTLTTDKSLLTAALDNIPYDGNWTNGSSGIYNALEIMDTSTAAYRYVIFLTDGYDNRYSYSYDDLIARAKEAGVIIYTIGLGTADEDTLKKIASETGGKYYRATTGSSSTEILNLDEVFEEIEEEAIDMITDSNNDGISDYYVKLINDGTLKLSNGTSWLVGVLDMYGDVDDWDGDGLKNGEEISVLNTNNKVYITMKSDPLLWDTDFDGYSDYEEVKTMKTSPLKITLPAPNSSVTASSGMYSIASSVNEDMKQVKYDGTFEDLYKYLDFSKGDHWMQYLFDWHKTEESKNALVDYFYGYTNTNAINDMQNRAALPIVLERLSGIIGNASEIMGTYKAVKNCANTIETLGFSDLTISSNASRANNAAKKKLEELNNAKKFDLSTLNNALKNIAKKAGPIDTVLNLGSSEFCKSETVIKGIEKDVINASDIGDFISTLKITDWTSSFNSLVKTTSKTISNATKLISTVANITKNTGTFVKYVATKNKYVKDWPVIFKSPKVRNFSTRKAVVESKTDVGKTAALKFTLITDAVVMAKDVVDVMTTYSKVWANVAAYQEYLDLLRYVEEKSTAPKYVKDGAHGITVLFNDADDPDWNKFAQEVFLATADKIFWNAAQMAVDIASNAFPFVKLVNTTYGLAKTTFSLIGVTERAKTIVGAQIYYSLVEGSSYMLDELGDFERIYYSVPDSDAKNEAQKYLTQLAQARIVGMNTVLKYISDGGPAGWVDRGMKWGNDDTAMKKSITNSYKDAINQIYQAVKKWGLVVSDKLPFFSDYGK